MVSTSQRCYRWRRQFLVRNVPCRGYWTVRIYQATLLFKFTANNMYKRLLLCGVYYCVWIKALPRIKGYELRQTVIEYENKSVVHHLVKVPKAEVARWDEEHDAEGKVRRRVARDSTDS